ncbi:MAG: SET domain-containing protein [Bacteroidales bacterium]|nr:SET domain-containing protein [Bacteroidales bacterium]
MIHPDCELKWISNEVGYGIVATRFIPKGTITWVQDKLDREFTPLDVMNMDGVYKDVLSKYTFRNNHGNYVLCWDNARYTNHSFNSNCLTTAYDFEIAIRDIQAGEELTDDYGYLNLPFPMRAKPEGTRRKVVHSDDIVKYYKVWDKKLISSFGDILKVIQPLRCLINDELWHKINRIAHGEEQMDSILTCYYDEHHSSPSRLN